MVVSAPRRRDAGPPDKAAPGRSGAAPASSKLLRLDRTAGFRADPMVPVQSCQLPNQYFE
jgi:hypothetical protein